MDAPDYIEVVEPGLDDDATGSEAQGDDGGEEEDGLDLLDLLEAMGGHFHEHHSEIVKWPWGLFCEKWARLVRYIADEQVKEREKKAKEREERRRGRNGRWMDDDDEAWG